MYETENTDETFCYPLLITIFGPLNPQTLKTILNGTQVAITVDRLCHQLIENHLDFSQSVLIGLQPRGIYLSDRIYHTLKKLLPGVHINYGKLDITFYRDDFNTSCMYPMRQRSIFRWKIKK